MAIAVLGVFSVVSAQASTITGAITSISTTSTSVGQWDQVDFTCNWAVPDGSQPGDTFTLTLPPELKWLGTTRFPLKDPDGNVVATGLVDDSGQVTFTLADFVLTHTRAIKGTCHFATLYTAQVTGEPTTLEFHVGSTVVPVTVPTGGACGAPCTVPRTDATKISTWDDAGQDRVQSLIRVPAMPSNGSDVTVVDTPKPGLALDCASVITHVGTTLGSGGYLVEPFPHDAQHPAVVDCTATVLRVTWRGLPAGDLADVWVKSTITDASLATYTNTADVTVNGVGTPVEGTVQRTDASGTGTGETPPATPTTEPTTTEPTTTEPTTTEPTTTEPTTTEPTTTEPTTTEPTTTEPTTTSAVVTTGSGTATGAQVAAPAASGGVLAFTGATASVALLGLAAALLAGGLVLMLVARRAAPRRH